MVKTLLENGADLAVNHVADDGHSALTYAVAHGQKEERMPLFASSILTQFSIQVVKTLLESPVIEDSSNKPALAVAARTGDVNMMDLLLLDTRDRFFEGAEAAVAAAVDAGCGYEVLSRLAKDARKRKPPRGLLHPPRGFF